MAKIVTLKDNEGNIVYPQTHIDAVVDDNGNTINELIANAVEENIINILNTEV